MTRVVLDTSVLIHFLIRPGTAIRQIIEEDWLTGALQVVSAPELLEELKGVLERPAIQAYIQPQEGQVLIKLLEKRGEFLPAMGAVPAFTRDPKDDKFVACAIAGRADFLITLDKDILVLGELGELKIVTPFGFVNRDEPD